MGLKQNLIFSIVLFTATSAKLYSQISYTQTIRGQIVDKQSKNPLAGCTVVLINSAPIQGAVTDVNGFYRFDRVVIGRQQLKFSFLGYKDALVGVILNTGKENIVNAELEEALIENKAVVISANRHGDRINNEMTTVSTRSFNIEETQRYAGSLNDPSRMAANYAGISSASDDRNDIIIRGNSPTGLLWRLNGVAIPNPNHFGTLGTTGGPVSILNNNTLDNSDFMTGAFPAEFGNANAGVFDLRMRNGNNEKHEFLGQIGFNGFELGAEGPFSKNSKASYMVNYRYSTLELFNKVGIDIGTGAAVPQYQDITFNMNVPTEKYGRFTLFGIGGKSHVDLLDSQKDTTKKNLYDLYGKTDIYYKANMGAVGLNHVYFFDSRTSGKFSLAATGTENITSAFDVNRAAPNSSIINSITPSYGQLARQISYITSYIVSKKFSNRNNINIGLTANRLQYIFSDSVEDNKTHLFRKLRAYNGESYFLQGFIQWQHRFTQALSLTTGLYSQHFTLNKTYSIEPRAGLRWEYRPGEALSLGAGMHSQLQPIGVYFAGTVLPNGVYTRTNINLDFTRSNHLVLAYDRLLNEDLRLRAETYYQYIYNVPVQQRASYYSLLNYGATFDDPNIDSLGNKGTGYNYGLEVTLEKFFSRNYYLLTTLSLFESKYRGSDGILRNTAFNSNYIGNFLAGREWKIGPRSVFSSNIRLTTSGGKRFVPINLTASRLAGEAVYYEQDAYKPQFKDYFRTDIKLQYRLNGKRITQEWVLDVQNIFNNQNIFLQEYNIPAQNISTRYQLGLFIVPQYRILF